MTSQATVLNVTTNSSRVPQVRGALFANLGTMNDACLEIPIEYLFDLVEPKTENRVIPSEKRRIHVATKSRDLASGVDFQVEEQILRTG